MKIFTSHGNGEIIREQFAKIGENVVIESGVKAFHLENIYLGSNIYIGHNAIIKGYHNTKLIIGDGTWIGQNAFIHGGGGIIIGDNVGIGPGVYILSSLHDISRVDVAIMNGELIFKPILLKDGCDIGVNSIILPGVTIGKCSQIGAGSVVTKDVGDYEVVAGNPAKFIRLLDRK